VKWRKRRWSHRNRVKHPVIEATEDPGEIVSVAVEYLDQLRSRHYSEVTVEGKSRHLRYFADWCRDRGITRPEEVTFPLLERYQRWLFHYRTPGGKPLAMHTQRSYVATLRPFFKWLVARRYLVANPASELVIPRRIKHLPRDILTAQEAEAVLRQADLTTLLGLRDRAILETFYSTGVRRIELLALKLYDLDLERGAAMIREGKGRRDRVVPLGERCQAWIEKYLADARPELVVEPDDSTVFLNNLGEPFSAGGLTSLVRDYVAHAGVPKKGACHLFRHTAATLMLEGGADIRYIQELLGHSELETTEIYTHVTIDKLQAVHRLSHPGAQLRRRGAGQSDEDALLEEFYRSFAEEAAEEDEDDEKGGDLATNGRT
jgi:integrase/recombinase XerD